MSVVRMIRLLLATAESLRHLQRGVAHPVAPEESWIIDGSLHLLAVRLVRADTVVFIDLPRRICLFRVVKLGQSRDGQASRRGWRHQMVVGPAPLGLENTRRQRLRILDQLAEHCAGADIVHLRSPREVRSFLRQVEPSPTAR